MRTRSARRNTASLLAVVLAVSAGACARTDAGEAQDNPVPEAGVAATDASGQPAAAPARTSQAAPTSSKPAAVAGGAQAEETEAAPPARAVAEGTSMVFTVDQTVSTEKQKVGDRFTATLAEPVLDAGGNTILAAGTVGQWVVSESTERNAEGQAVLAVALEMVDVGGTWHPVAATVTDVALKTDTRDSGKETAAKIGIGTAAGALAGKLLGGSKEATLKGAGAGAAIGTAVALATRGGSASIQQGSKITVRLDQKLELPPS
ncbi:MAG: hypothetical protein FIA95_12430 [Gemmatimonadetes bacterium]|nr:hypothetical protein [Gemmatimonadota bacterium]